MLQEEKILSELVFKTMINRIKPVEIFDRDSSVAFLLESHATHIKILSDRIKILEENPKKKPIFNLPALSNAFIAFIVALSCFLAFLSVIFSLVVVR